MAVSQYQVSKVHTCVLSSNTLTLNWNSTWAMTDDVSQVHKYRQERILRNGLWVELCFVNSVNEETLTSTTAYNSFAYIYAKIV